MTKANSVSTTVDGQHLPLTFLSEDELVLKDMGMFIHIILGGRNGCYLSHPLKLTLGESTYLPLGPNGRKIKSDCRYFFFIIFTNLFKFILQLPRLLLRKLHHMSKRWTKKENLNPQLLKQFLRMG